jgi:hypothetical protein
MRSALPWKAARTASRTPSGEHLLWVGSVGMSTSMPDQRRVLLPAGNPMSQRRDTGHPDFLWCGREQQVPRLRLRRPCDRISVGMASFFLDDRTLLPSPLKPEALEWGTVEALNAC